MRKSIMIWFCLLFSLSLLTTSVTAGTPSKASTTNSAHRIKRYLSSEVNNARRKGCVKDEVALQKLQQEYGPVVRYIPDAKNLKRSYQFKSFEQIIKDGGGDCEDLAKYGLIRLIEMGVSKSQLGFQIWWEKGRTSGHVEPLVWLKNRVYAVGTRGEIVDAEQDLIGRKSSLRSHAVVRLDSGKLVIKFDGEITADSYFE